MPRQGAMPWQKVGSFYGCLNETVQNTAAGCVSTIRVKTLGALVFVSMGPAPVLRLKKAVLWIIVSMRQSKIPLQNQMVVFTQENQR